MQLRLLIAELAERWADEPRRRRGSLAVATAELPVSCELCASSDLLSADTAASWSHEVIHGLVAPIEEVVDVAVERFLATDREQRLGRVDLYRSRLRTSARAVVDRALMQRAATTPADD